MNWILGFVFGVVLASDIWAGPHIVLIVSDDQGYSDLGVVNDDVITPNLDRLAKEGVRLTNFYVTWPACTPSRGSLLTGRYPQRNGMWDMVRNEAPDFGKKYDPAEYAVTWERIGGMDTREVLLPKVLQGVGYRSALFGKWDLGIHRRFLPLQRGFDEFYGFVNTGIDYYTHERYGVPSMYRGNAPTEEDKGEYCTGLFEREALAFLKKVNNGRGPFFLYLPFNAPHNSSSLDPLIRGTVQAPEEFKKMYPAVEKETQKGMKYGKEAMVPTREARRRDYLAAVTCMDASIGKVLDALDKMGVAEDTLVVFFSDNGGGGGAVNAPLRGKKADMWEGGIRVPFLARWPGKIPAGMVRDDFVTSLELFPTFAKVAGAELPDGVSLDGFDMMPVLKGEKKSEREAMFWKRRDHVAARVENWKWVDMGERGGGLFDLSSDLGEKVDLSKAKPEVLEMVKGKFADWMDEMEKSEPRGPFRDY